MTTPEDGAHQDRKDIQQRASRGALWTGLQALISLPLNVVSTVLVARLLGTEGYGQLAYLTIVFAVVLQVTDFGYTSSAIQWGSEARAKGDGEALRRRLSQATGFHVLVQAPLTLMASLLIFLEEGPAWGLAYGLGTAFFLYVSCGSLALVLDQRNDVLAKVALVANIVSQVGVVIAAVATRDAVVILFVRTVLNGLPGLLALLFIPGEQRRAVLRPGRFLAVPPGYWRYAVFSWMAGCIAVLVYSRSEVLVLEATSTAEQTGLFALAYGVSEQLTGPVNALIGPLLPATAALVAAHGAHVARAASRAMSLSSLLAGLLLAGAVPALFGVFPLLYGDEFAAAAGLLLVLAAITTFRTATSVIELLVQAQRRGGRLLAANAVALAFNLGLAFALIPSMGAWGAIVANACGQLVSVSLLIATVTSGADGIPFSMTMRAIRPWFAAIPGLVAGALTAGAARDALTDVGAAVAAGLVGLAVYVVVLRVTRTGPQHEELVALTGTLPERFRRPVGAVLSTVAAR